MNDATLLQLWAAEELAVTVAPGTAKEYRRYAELFAAKHSLTTATRDEVRSWLAAHDWAPATRSWALRSLRSLYRWLVAEHIVATEPTEGIRVPSAPEAVLRVAEADVREALCAAAGSKRDRAMVECLFGSGMRLGELCGLTVGDVDIDAASALVRRTKAGRPRTVPIETRSMAPLRQWLVVRMRRPVECDALWLTDDDRALTYEGTKQVFKRLSRRAGVPFSPHDARRGYATRWLAAGGSETGLMRACGWSSVRMVARYSRSAGEQLAVAEARRLFG